MQTLEIKITVPDGTQVVVTGLGGITLATPDTLGEEDAVERYWYDYLSDNARKVYGAAARIETTYGIGYTLEDIAQTLSIDYESARSFHRTSGRAAKQWRNDTGAEEPPIRLVWIDYTSDDAHGGMRTTYHLPPTVAEAIEYLPITGGRPA